MRVLGLIVYFAIAIAGIVATSIWEQWWGTGLFSGAVLFGVYAALANLAGVFGARSSGDRVEFFAALYLEKWYDWLVLVLTVGTGTLLGGLGSAGVF